MRCGESHGSFLETRTDESDRFTLASACLLQPTNREFRLVRILRFTFPSTADLFRSFEKEVITISKTRPYRACWSTPDHSPRGETALPRPGNFRSNWA